VIPRCPFAIWTPGPRNLAPGTFNNFGYSWTGEFSPKRGAVLHDSTGPLQPTLNVVLAGGVPNWHFTVDDATGLVYQHYEVEANCWHGNDTDPDDGVSANIDFVGIEHTRPNARVASKLTEAGISATVALNQWLAEVCGFSLIVRFPDQVGAWALADHNQVGNTPTACPSGRIPFDEILRRLHDPRQEDDDMTPQFIKRKGSHETYRAEGKAFVLNKSAVEREDYGAIWALDVNPALFREVEGAVLDRGKARGWVKE
jgi:hypothetical protein